MNTILVEIDHHLLNLNENKPESYEINIRPLFLVVEEGI